MPSLSNISKSSAVKLMLLLVRSGADAAKKVEADAAALLLRREPGLEGGDRERDAVRFTASVSAQT